MRDAQSHQGMTSIPNSDALNWVIAPAGRCVTYIGEETKTAAVVQRALAALAGQEPLARAALRGVSDSPQAATALLELLAQQPELRRFAQEIINSDFHSVNAHGLVGIWVAVEVAVEDTVVLVLLKDPEAKEAVTAAGVRLPVLPPNGMDEPTARRIYSRFERVARADRTVASAYCYMLGKLGFTLQLEAPVVSTLDEMNYIRNCILHRGGIIDDRAGAEAPQVALREGDAISVTSHGYLRYFDAAAGFADALLRATLASRYIRTVP